MIFGNLFTKKLFKDLNFDKSVESIISIIILSNLFLILNFFTSLNKFINTFIFIIPLIYIFFLNKKIIFEIFVFSLLFSVFFVFFVSFDNVNRPDAGLYHLPYISILNEHKIILGSANLHFRFGHTSILQYLEAGFNNLIFKDLGILIPKTIIFYSVCIYFLKEFYLNINSKKSFFSIFSFFILFQILYDMNRYSYHGNDIPAHLIIYFISYFFLKNDLSKYNNFYLICLLCLYSFQIKSTSIVMLFLPIGYVIFYKKLNFLLNLKNSLLLFFITSWFIKNILISGCVIFPVKQTCYNNFYWNSSLLPSENDVYKVSEENEAWAKSWPDRKNKSQGYKEYINTDWTKVWLRSHGKNVVSKKIIPLIVLILIVYILTRKQLKNLIFYNYFFKKQIILLSILLFGSFLWFIKFPTYRYGSSYIVGSLVFSQFYFVKEVYLQNYFKKFMKILLFILTVSITLKYTMKYEQTKQIWPNIYSFTSNSIKPKEFEKIYKNNKFLYYRTDGGELCMYSKSPCTNISVHEKVNLKIKNGYKIYYLEK